MKNNFLSAFRFQLLNAALISVLCIVVFALPYKSIAQVPSNDNCANAIVLTMDAVPLDGTLANSTITSGISTFTALIDVWYIFTATCSTHTVQVTYGNGLDIYYEIYNSTTCPLSGSIRTANAPGSTSNPVQLTGLTIGSKYYIRVIDHKLVSPPFKIFVTSAAVTPSLTSLAATNKTTTTATLNGNIGTLPCPTISKGFVYCLTTTSSNPLNGTTGVTKMSVSGLTTGAYTLALTGLTAGTSYTSNAYIFDGTTYTYGTAQTFTTISTNADLSALVFNTATILPSFVPATTAYSATVTNATLSVTITATKSNVNATIQLQLNNGGYSALTSGTASSSLTLNVGSNTIDVKVTAEDGLTTKIYTITVCRSVLPGVSIVASANPVCSGASVTFTATPTNGGTPMYQWQNGGTNISGATTSTFTSSSLTNSNSITVIMTSTATCANPITATSNTVTMTVNGLPIATTSSIVHDNCQVGAGAITLSVSGGKPNYTIAACGKSVSPSPSVGQYVTVAGSPASGITNSKTFSGLGGNIAYQFTITDANGCVAQ